MKATVSGGVGSVTYKTRSYFTGGGASDRTIQLWVDGNLEESFTLPAMGTIYTRTVSGIDAAGSVEIEFRATGSRQIVLDTVSWTGYVPATDQPPTMGALDVTGIGSTTATFESEVTDDGGQPVTARGFVYSLTATNDDPLIGGSGVTQVSSGTGTGSFDESVSGLTVGAEYSVKAYATNTEGTTYTPVETFKTFPALVAFNTPYEKNFSGFNSAATIPAGWEVTDDTYDGDWGSGASIGLRGNDNVLGYQHTAASGNFTITLTLVNETGDTIENLVVEYMGMVERTGVGRSPEWTVEVDGSEVAALFYSTSGGVDELKSTTVTGLSIANGETFTITWTSDRGGPSGASKQIGISDVHVEAIGAATAPTVTTTPITVFGPVSATVGGNVTSDGGEPVTARGVAYNTTGNPTTADSTLSIGSGTGSFSDTLSGLTPGETYYVRAYATNTEGTSYGDEESFTTECVGAPTGVGATDVTLSSFTAEWNTVAGATGYRLDVSTSPIFGEGGGSEGFETGLPTSYTSETEFELASGTWIGSANQVIRGTVGVQSGSYSLQLRNQAGANMRTPVFGGGVDNLSFYVTSSTASGSLQVNLSSDGGDTWDPAPGSPFTGLGTTTTLISIDVEDEDVDRIEFRRTAATIYIDDVDWTPMDTDGNLPGYDDLPVSGNSQSVTGLDEDTTYYFRVRAESANCLSEDSAIQSVFISGRPIDAVWTGAGSDNNTMTEENWDGDLYPSTTASSVMRFAGSTRTSPVVNYPADSAFGSIYFNDGAAAFTLSGNRLSLHELIRNDSASLQTLNNPFTLADEVTVWADTSAILLGGDIDGAGGFIKRGAEALTLDGDNTFSGGVQHSFVAGTRVNIGHVNALGSGVYQFNVGGEFDNTSGANLAIANALQLEGGSATYVGSTHNLTFAGSVTLNDWRRITVLDNELILTGAFQDGATAGRLYKWGDGTLTLAGNNAHTDGVTHNEGRLNLNGANVIGIGGQFWIRSGGDDGGDPLEEYGYTSFGNTSGGLVTVANAYRFDNQFATTFVGPDPLTLSGTGTLARDEVSIAVDGGRLLALSGPVSQTGGDRALTKLGEGTLRLTGDSTFFGPVRVEEGVLEISQWIAASDAQPLGQKSDVTRVHVYLGSDGKEAVLRYTGSDSATTKNIELVAGGVGVVEIVEPETLMEMAAGAFSAIYSGSGELRKRGPGTLYFTQSESQSSTMTGDVFIEAGALRLRQGNALATAGEVTIENGGALELFTPSANRTYSLGTAPLTLNGVGVGGQGALRAVGTAHARVYEGSIAMASESAFGADSGTILTLSGPISGDASAGLVKVGEGQVILNDITSTYAGPTTINEGILTIRGVASLGANPSELQPGHLTINGGMLYRHAVSGDDDATGGFTINTNRGLTIGGEGGRIGAQGGRVLTYNGVLLGTGDLLQTARNEVSGEQGLGTVVLGGNNAGYPGQITVRRGTLRITHSNALGSTTGDTIVEGSTDTTRSGTLELQNNITTAAQPLMLAGMGRASKAALWTENGNNTFAGPITLTTNASVGARLASHSLTLNASTAITGSGYDLTVQRAGRVYIESVISTGSGKLIKNDSGTLTLTAENEYAGGTELHGGVTQISTDRNLGAVSGSVTFDGGTLRALDSLTLAPTRSVTLESSGGAIDVSDAVHSVHYDEGITGPGTLTKSGPGTLHLTGANTYEGGTLVSGGVLRGDAISLQGGVTNNATLWMDQDIHATNDTLALRGSGMFRKTGASDLTLEEPLLHTGPTRVEEGVLRLASVTNEADFIVFADAAVYATGYVGNAIITGRVSTALGEAAQGRLTATNLVLANDAEIDVRVFNTASGSVIHVTDDVQVTDRVVINLSATADVNWFQDIVLVSHGGDSDEGLQDGDQAANWEVVFDESIPESLRPIMTNIYWRATNSGEYYIRNPGLVLDVRIKEGEALNGGTNEAARLGVKTLQDLEYDLISLDAEEYNGSGSWTFAKRVTAASALTSFTNELNGMTNGGMRFYRASPLGAWSNATGRLVSEEVYVAQYVRLTTNQNWVAYPGIPDTNTVAHVFGTDLPSGALPGLSTRITWYERTGSEFATQQVWLATGGSWQYSLGGDGSADDVVVPLDQGVIIELPPGVPNASFVFVGRVPTNTISQTIKGGGAYNLVSAGLPRHMHPSEMNLLESGFIGGHPALSDWIFRYDREQQQVLQVVYYDDGSLRSEGWHALNGDAVEKFRPDDAIVIRTGGSTDDWTWTLNPSTFYPQPSRFLD